MIRRGASSSPGGELGGGGSKSGLNCRVLMLDGKEMSLEINKKTPGQWIYDCIFKKLNILEGDYFGLLYEDEQKCQQWLDILKPVKKQTKKNPSHLFFCVKFYPVDPVMTQPSTRAQLYWQVKRDFFDGRLPCTPDIAIQLCGYVGQVELGDCVEVLPQYLTRLGLFKAELQKLEDDIIKQHKQFKGMTPLDAMSAFLDLASSTEFYGMVFFEVRHEEKVPYILGLSPYGLALCKEFTVLQSYAWNRVVQVSYKGKKFTVKVSGDWAINSKSYTIRFDVDSTRTCRELYDTFIEHINFYKEPDDKTKATHGKGTSHTKMPSSVSSEGLSHLSTQDGSVRNKPLQRSQSLPRKSHHRSLAGPNPIPRHSPYPTNTTVEDPILKALQSRKQRIQSETTSLMSPTETVTSSSEENHSPSNLHQTDTQSLDSRNPMHDSLLDLADNLGKGEEEEEESMTNSHSKSVPHQHFHSFSLPIDSMSSSPDNHVTLENRETHQKKQNRLLVHRWVKEQKKKDQNDLFSSSVPPPPMTNGAQYLSPPKAHTLPHSPSSSPPRSLKLKPPDSNSSLSQSPTESSYSYYRPNSAAASTSYQIDDHYSIPRLSPAPSPYLFHKPHPFSNSKCDLLPPSRASSHNDYDIPRSITDLCYTDSPLVTARSESSLTGITSLSGHHPLNSHQDSLSSIPLLDSKDQAMLLKDEYPDYDIPRPSIKEYPDYDVPKSLFAGKKSPLSDSETQSSNSGMKRKIGEGVASTGDISFGILDSIMAEINEQVAATQLDSNPSHLTSRSLPSFTTPEVHLESQDASATLSSQSDKHISVPSLQPSAPLQGTKEPLYDHLPAKVTLRIFATDGVVVTEDNGSKSEDKEQNIIDGETYKSKESIVLETSTPEKALSVNTTPEKVVSENAMPEKVSSENAMPEKVLSVNAMPEKVTSENAMPDKVTSENAIPENALLEKENTTLEEETLENSTLIKIKSNPIKLENNATEDFPQPPSHLADLMYNLQGLPFDPNFFAQQTALEQERGLDNAQLPPQVARFMSWVKTGSMNADEPSKTTPSSGTSSSNQLLRRPSKEDKFPSPPSTKEQPRPQQEPIYHEITNKIVSKLDPSLPPVQNGHKTSSLDSRVVDSSPSGQPLHNGSPESVSVSEDSGKSTPGSTHSINEVAIEMPNKSSNKTQEKENEIQVQKISNSQRPSMIKREASMPAGVHRGSDTGHKRWHSFNTRRPLQIKLETPPLMQSSGDESIPNSPSFYTHNRIAATMPLTRPSTGTDGQESRHLFHEQLTKLDSGVPGRHNRVVSWMKGARKFWEADGLSKTIPVPMTQTSTSKSQLLQASQSVHSHLGQSIRNGGNKTGVHDKTGTPNQSNKFKDHLYEDPDIVLQSNFKQRKATEPYVQTVTSYPYYRAHQAAGSTHQRMPYVTREFQRSADGGSMYATDV